MKIGIIGTGNIGGELARKLVRAGHSVHVANSKGIEGVKGFAEEIGAHPADVYGAVQGVELVILSIPFSKVPELPKDLFEALAADVPVVDTTNYYPGILGPQMPEVDAAQAESLWVSEQIGRPVIKAFNNIMSTSLSQFAKPRGGSDRLAVAVAGDNAVQKDTVMRLVDEIGFDPVNGGTLPESWRQQPCTPSYCCDFGAADMAARLQETRRGEARPKLAELPNLFASLGANPSHADVIAANRKLSAGL